MIMLKPLKLLFAILLTIVLVVGIFFIMPSNIQNNVIRITVLPLVNNLQTFFKIKKIKLNIKQNSIELLNVKFNAMEAKILIPNVNIKYDLYNQGVELSFTKIVVADYDMAANFYFKNNNFRHNNWDITVNDQNNKCIMDFYNGSLSIKQCSFTDNKTVLNLSGQIITQDEGLSKVQLDTNFENLTIKTYNIIKLFSKNNKIIKFLDEYAVNGKLSGSVTLDIDQIQTTNFSEKNLSGTIRISEGTLKYDEDLPAVKDIEGIVKIQGPNVEAKISNACSCNAKSQEAKVNFIWNGIKESIVELDVDITALAKDSSDFLTKGYRKKLESQGINLKSSKGSVEAKLIALIPLAPDKPNSWHIDGRINDFELKVADNNVVLSKANIKFKLDNKTLKAQGQGKLNGYFANLKYSQDMPYTLCKFDSEIDLSKPENINPIIKITNNAILKIQFEDLNNKQSLRINSDLTDTELETSFFQKKAKTKLTLEAYSQENLTNLNIKLQGKDKIFLTGNLDVTNRTFNNIKFNSNNVKDFTGSIKFEPNKTTINGQALNIDFSEYNLLTTTQVSKTPISLDIKINNLILKNQLILNDFTLLMECNKDFCTKNNMTASIEGQSLEAKLISSNTEEQNWQISTKNAGGLFKALGIYSKIDKGNMLLDISTKRPPTPFKNGLPLIKGHITINDFFAVKTPIITKIFTFTSVPGLVNLLTNDIKFQKLEASFNVFDGVINIMDSNVVGPSFDLKMIKGAINTDLRKIILKGVVVPSIYGLNKLINSVPVFNTVINTLLNRKKVEGLIFIPFNVEDTY